MKHQTDIQIFIFVRCAIAAVKYGNEQGIDDARQRIMNVYEKEQWLPEMPQELYDSLSLHYKKKERKICWGRVARTIPTPTSLVLDLNAFTKVIQFEPKFKVHGGSMVEVICSSLCSLNS